MCDMLNNVYMQKKALTTIILAIASHLILFAYNNNAQKIYPVGSEIYEAITHLYFLNGRTMPSNAAPWSADELNKMLQELDYKSLSPTEKSLYDYAKSELNLKEDLPKIRVVTNADATNPTQQITTDDGEVFNVFDFDVVPFVKEDKPKIFKFGLEANLELYTHTNTNKQFVGRQNWNYHFIKHKPVVAGTFEVWPANNFYTIFEIPLGNYMFHTNKSNFGDNYFMTNIPLLQDITKLCFDDIDLNPPYKAFIAAGGSHWSMQLGRDRMSWGPGVVSNFVVGDNLKYHNMFRFTTYYGVFKYTFALSFFPHPKNYATNGDGGDVEGTGKPWGLSKNGQDSVFDGINMFMAHRLEWRFWKDKFKIALTESIMYQSANNFLDLQILNPLMFFHDLYIRSNSNSILALELEYTPIKNLNLYYQMVVDEISMGAEAKPGVADRANPNAMGFMLGAKYDHIIDKGVLFSSIEWAYTDPYLYLRDNGNGIKQEEGTYGINYVVALRQLTPSTDYYGRYDGSTWETRHINGTIIYDEQFLGYRYGGDAITLNLNCGYKVYKKWNAETNLFYMAHGTHDMWTLWMQVSPSTNVTTPTHKEHSGNQKGNNGKNAVAHYFVVGFSGGYYILKDFRVYGQLDFVNIWNAGNISGNYQFDMQLTTGISYSI